MATYHTRSHAQAGRQLGESENNNDYKKESEINHTYSLGEKKENVNMTK